MKFISSSVHGVIDYLVACWLIAFPWIFDLKLEHPAGWVPVSLGIAVILYSAFTNYEMGLFRIIRYQHHLIIDLAGAFLLATSPWLFAFHESVWKPHLFTAIAEFAVIFLSQRYAFAGSVQNNRI